MKKSEHRFIVERGSNDTTVQLVESTGGGRGLGGVEIKQTNGIETAKQKIKDWMIARFFHAYIFF